MTLFTAIFLTASCSLFSWRFGCSRTGKIGLAVLAFAWLGIFVLGVWKISLGCRALGDCYGTEYDLDLAEAQAELTLLLFLGWLLIVIGLVRGWRRKKVLV